MLAVVAAGQSPVCAPHSCAIAVGGGGGPDAGSYSAMGLPSSHEMPRGRAGQWEHRTAPQVCGARAGTRPRAPVLPSTSVHVTEADSGAKHDSTPGFRQVGVAS